MKTFDIAFTELFDLFILENLTRKQVAEYYGCSEILIKKKCQSYGIKKSKSLESMNKERRVDKTCLRCGKTFSVVRYREAAAKFCTHKCSRKFLYLGEDYKRKMLNDVAARRRARYKNALVDLSDVDRDRIKEIYLNCPSGYEVDHKIPLAKGGKHHPDNLQYLTMSENRKKHTKCLLQ